jgi:ribosome-associated translation inhibitor RaiA
MSFPIEIHFRGMTPSESVERQVRDWAEKLETTSTRIQRCEVAIEQPHRHSRQGRQFHVRIALTVPGQTIVVSDDPGDQGAHEDAHVTIRDAFRTLRRRLAEHVHADDHHGAQAGRA